MNEKNLDPIAVEAVKAYQSINQPHANAAERQAAIAAWEHKAGETTREDIADVLAAQNLEYMQTEILQAHRAVEASLDRDNADYARAHGVAVPDERQAQFEAEEREYKEQLAFEQEHGNGEPDYETMAEERFTNPLSDPDVHEAWESQQIAQHERQAAEQPRQATDLEKAEVISSDLSAYYEMPEDMPEEIKERWHSHVEEIGGIYCRAAETLDAAARDIMGAKGSYDERTDYALNVVAKRPEVIEAHKIADMLAPHATNHMISKHLSRTDPERGYGRNEVAQQVLAQYQGNWSPPKPHHARLSGFQGAAGWARDELKDTFGVREPANPVDIKRAGTEAQSFAEAYLYPAEAAFELSAAAAPAREMEREAQSIARTQLCRALEGGDQRLEMSAALQHVHEMRALTAKAASKTYTREQLQALADKCDPRDFSSREDLPAAYQTMGEWNTPAEGLREKIGEERLATLVDAAERNQTTNKQAQNIAAQRGRGHGFSR